MNSAVRAPPTCSQPVGEIVPKDIRDYLRARVDREGVHKTTANKELTTLRSVFNFAQKQEYVAKNPARMVDRFSLDAEDKEQLQAPVYIPRDIYEALLHSKAARSHTPVRALMFLLYHTGMRIGELLRLRWQDVDLNNKVLHVTASPQKGGDRTPYMVSRQLRLYLRFATREARRAYEAGKWGKGVRFDRIAVIPNGHGRPWTYTNVARRMESFFGRFRPRESQVLQAIAASSRHE